MSLHLAEIAACVAPGAHAVLLLDQAGWHLSDKLVAPANLTLLPLPPKCPELNPVENIWQYLRDNWLSNRVFPSYRALSDEADGVIDHALQQCPCCRLTLPPDLPSVEVSVHERIEFMRARRAASAPMAPHPVTGAVSPCSARWR